MCRYLCSDGGVLTRRLRRRCMPRGGGVSATGLLPSARQFNEEAGPATAVLPPQPPAAHHTCAGAADFVAVLESAVAADFVAVGEGAVAADCCRRRGGCRGGRLLPPSGRVPWWPTVAAVGEGTAAADFVAVGEGTAAADCCRRRGGYRGGRLCHRRGVCRAADCCRRRFESTPSHVCSARSFRLNANVQGIVAPVLQIAIDDAAMLVAVDAGDKERRAIFGDLQRQRRRRREGGGTHIEAHASVADIITSGVGSVSEAVRSCCNIAGKKAGFK